MVTSWVTSLVPAEQRDVSPGRDRDELEDDEALEEDDDEDVDEDAPLLLPTEMTE